MINQTNTAILFFSRTAEEEATVKVFDSSLSYKENKAISKSLITHSLDVCKNSDFPLFSFFSNKQEGSCFGEKLANVIENVFSAGFENVITVGNDCPFITTDLIKNSAKQLESGKMVLGPAKDGGVYLVGITQENYSRKRFISLDWKSKMLQESFVAYARKADVKINWLDQFSDIDCEIEFRQALSMLSEDLLLYIVLTQILSRRLSGFVSYNYNYQSIVHKTHAQRGPPMAA